MTSYVPQYLEEKSAKERAQREAHIATALVSELHEFIEESGLKQAFVEWVLKKEMGEDRAARLLSRMQSISTQPRT